ncbi:MAG: hypothetical protein Q8Q85_15260 [Gemmatimonadales bacterium]|nr:hypothetical protein [Gemmatimonadales bacterium]
MSRSSLRSSVLALALIAAASPAPAAASIVVPSVDDTGAALRGGIAFLKRVLHRRQGDDVVSHSIAVSNREATLELELASGKMRSLSLRGGAVLVDGERVGRYAAGGPLDRAWRRLLADGGSLDTRELLVSLRAWRAPSLGGDDAASKVRLDAALGALAARRTAPPVAAAVTSAHQRADSAVRRAASPASHPVSITMADISALDTVERQLAALEDVGADVAAAVRTSPMHLGDYRVGAGERFDGNLVVFKGTADVYGEVTGNVIALYGDVANHRGGTIGRSAVSVGGEVLDDGGTFHGDIKTLSAPSPEDLPNVDVDVDVNGDEDVARATPSWLDRLSRDVLNIVGVFIAFAMMGFGAVFFGRRYLEIVADTASHSFGRSLVVGMLGQLLVLPTFAMLIVGLVFTIVGILLLPFVIPAFVVATAVVVLGGYLAVAHSVGETVTRRQMAHGAFVRAPNAYGYLFRGLVALLGLWAAAALFGWAGPVVILFQVAAGIVTWMAATVGFGAVLLSRAGLRETFAGRHFGEMSDEYLWATPPATPTASRMGMKS